MVINHTGILCKIIQWHTLQINSVVPLNVLSKPEASTRLWPPWSPNSNLCGFYLWVTLREMYANNPKYLEENIRHEISTISIQQLWYAQNMFSRCQACLEAEGPHFETLLQNKVLQPNVDRELMDTTAGLCKKGTISTAETSLRIICPLCVTALHI
jgi:hypothetical protein